MRRFLCALPAAVLLAGCVGTPADSPMEPTLQSDRTQTLLPPSVGAQYGMPAPTYDRKQDLPVLALTTSLTSVVIDFESLAAADGSFTFLTTYSEDGFTLANPSEPNASDAFGSPHSGNTSYYQGSAALINNYPFTSTVLTKDDGGPFNVVSIDLAEITTDGGAAEVPFTGTRADGSTVSATFTTDGVEGFQTFTFDGFTDLVSLSWDQIPAYHQFDNINLTFGTADPQDPQDPPDPQDPQPKAGNQDKSACMKGGWEQMGFKNQGQCVRFVETGKDSR